MPKTKKILSLLIKIIIGIGSLGIIYWRLRTDLSPDKTSLLLTHIFSATGLLALLGCFFLVPVNWGIEAVKWKIITAPLQWISVKTAVKSVCSGVCLGNLAPGRATEFLAKIIFFKPEHRPSVTVLHFVGGLFQLVVTLLAGLIALLLRISDFEGQFSWIRTALPVTAVVILVLFVFSIIKIDPLLHMIGRRFNKKNADAAEFSYHFTTALVFKLLGFSALRYAVFFMQYYLLILMLAPGSGAIVFPGIALYFFITTIVPMVSALEPAIRAAIALVVFRNSGLGETIPALCTVVLWIFNIILPSLAGYYFLLKKNFDFRFYKKPNS